MQASCQWGLSAHQESIISTVVFVGALAGAYCWGLLADSQGRRVGFAATALFTFLFGFLSAVAPSFGVCPHVALLCLLCMIRVPLTLVLQEELCSSLSPVPLAWSDTVVIQF